MSIELIIALVLAFVAGILVALVGVAAYNEIADVRAERRALAMFGAAIESNVARGARYEGDDFIRGDMNGSLVPVSASALLGSWLDPFAAVQRATEFASAARTPTALVARDDDDALLYPPMSVGLTDEEYEVVHECGF